MSMTKKQAKEFVDNDASWESTVFWDLVRVGFLKFKGHTWMRVEVLVLQMIDVYRGAKSPRKYWRTDLIYEWDTEANAAGITVSRTQLAQQIWELDRV